eukprot:CAMPEP_0184485898 /NCGR_PEP_ID=MMETSP0113_2-20130426/7466_1 /TAXON_ID=91329 /ORGANISM="Norrisiella sphaerica, Strain BC52" /LENGTH=462 /DNA_ID=CAMNT_0026867553 /DNA_START=321 /DNA_END=1709 /DNA_ORIENTATION=+
MSTKQEKKGGPSVGVGAGLKSPAAKSVKIEPVDVGFDEVAGAYHRIRGDILRTACDRSHYLSKTLGMDIYLKREYQHESGSFKERGACNALHRLDPEQKTRGVIAASAGNHALALARHGKRMGIPVTVVMPTVAPMTKVNNCREYGARVLINGKHIVEAKDYAEKLVEEEGLTYINGYDHPDIIAGAGTVGWEALEQVPDLDAIVVPVGGAGLIAGIAVVVKTLKPDVQVIGVEPKLCASYTASLGAGKVVDHTAGATLADGLAVPRIGENAFLTAKDRVDKIICVDESSIALSVLRLTEMEKCVVEGGGATGLAALLAGECPELKGKKVVLPLCGGNIDITVLGRVIERGLAADGRLLRFVSTVSDRPGGINGVTKILSEQGASIKEIFHERAWLQSNVYNVQIKCVIEVIDREHGRRVHQELIKGGFPTLMMNSGDEAGREFMAESQDLLGGLNDKGWRA